MDNRILSTTLGGCGAFLWFMPFASIDNPFARVGGPFGNSGALFASVGEKIDLSGNSFGGIAYLLLAAFVFASSLSWLRQYVPMLIAAGVACAICTLFLVEAGSSVRWGLIASEMVAVSMVVSAVNRIRSGRSSTIANAGTPFV